MQKEKNFFQVELLLFSFTVSNKRSMFQHHEPFYSNRSPDLVFIFQFL